MGFATMNNSDSHTTGLTRSLQLYRHTNTNVAHANRKIKLAPSKTDTCCTQNMHFCIIFSPMQTASIIAFSAFLDLILLLLLHLFWSQYFHQGELHRPFTSTLVRSACSSPEPSD